MILHCLRAINRGLANIARGGHVATELHNVEAHTLQAFDLAPFSREAAMGAEELLRAAAALASAPELSRACLDWGEYSPELERARRRSSVSASATRGSEKPPSPLKGS